MYVNFQTLYPNIFIKGFLIKWPSNTRFPTHVCDTQTKTSSHKLILYCYPFYGYSWSFNFEGLEELLISSIIENNVTLVFYEQMSLKTIIAVAIKCALSHDWNECWNLINFNDFSDEHKSMRTHLHIQTHNSHICITVKEFRVSHCRDANISDRTTLSPVSNYIFKKMTAILQNFRNIQINLPIEMKNRDKLEQQLTRNNIWMNFKINICV